MPRYTPQPSISSILADDDSTPETEPQVFKVPGSPPPPQDDDDDELPTMQPFPIHVLPPVLRAFVNEAGRVAQVPAELPVACCLATVSASLGKGLQVETFNGKRTPGNIMVLCSAETGSGKSETFRLCVAPFQQCHQDAIENWRDFVFPTARANVRILEAQLKKWEKSVIATGADVTSIGRQMAEAERKLAVARLQMEAPAYILANVTTSKLITILCRMDGQAFLASPDAKNIVDQVLGKYNEGQSDEEVHLKMFSFESIDQHRTGTGSVETPRACGAGLWLTQPDKLDRLLESRSMNEGGLLPRILVFTANCPPSRIDINASGVNPRIASQYEDLIRGLFNGLRAKNDEHIIEAEPLAQLTIATYHETIRQRRAGGDLQDVTGFAARWAELAWKLALVVHAARCGADKATTPLTVEDAEAGVAIADWFAAQQLDALRAGRLAAERELHKAVFRLIQEKGGEITARDVYRANITTRKDVEQAEQLLDRMATLRLLTFENRPTLRKNHTQRVYVKA